MYILKHAWKNIWRNKGRNLLVTAILLAILTTTVVTLMINDTATALITDYTALFSSQVVINPDMEQLRQEATSDVNAGAVKISRPTLDPELLLSFTNSDYLKESVVNASLRANSDTVVAIDETSEGAAQMGMMGAMSSGNFNVLGDDYTAFTEGNRILVDDGISNYPNGENEALISTELATENSLAIGDTITLSSLMSMTIPTTIDTTELVAGDTIEINGLTYTLVLDQRSQTLTAQRTAEYELLIVGLYEDIRDEYADENMPQSAAFNNRNEIITSLETLLAIRAQDETGVSIDVEYYLQNPEDITAFEAEVREKGLPTTFTVTTDATTYDQLVSPLAGIRNIAITFLAIVLILGAIIIMLLTSISIRERKYEIGVLRAMGMKKNVLALSFWLELAIITITCVVLGMGAGTLVAKPVSNSLLTAQTQQTQQTTNSQMPGGGMGMGAPTSGMIVGGKGQQSQSQAITLEPTLSLLTVGQIFVISLLLSSVAGVIAVRQITRYEPMKILSERN
ncbi:MAG: ABC transporter permease [Culicoidibacterales bacterium]